MELLEEQVYQLKINKLIIQLENLVREINEVRRELLKLSLNVPCQ